MRWCPLSTLLCLLSAFFCSVVASQVQDVTSAVGWNTEDGAGVELELDLGGVGTEKVTLAVERADEDELCNFTGLLVNGRYPDGDEDIEGTLQIKMDDGRVGLVDYTVSLLCASPNESRDEAIMTAQMVFKRHDSEHDDRLLALVFSYSQLVGEHRSTPEFRRILVEDLKDQKIGDSALSDHLRLLASSLFREPANFHAISVSEPSKLDEDSHLSSQPQDSSPSTDRAPIDLQSELLTLELLQAHAAEIEEEIKATQARIMTIWKSDFAQCSSLKCYLKTALAKVPSFVHLLATHFSHHNHLNATFFTETAHMNCSDEVERVVVAAHSQQATLINPSAEATTSTNVLPASIENPTPAAPPPTDASASTFPLPHSPATISTLYNNYTPPSFATIYNTNPSFQARFKYAFIITAAFLISLIALSLALFLFIRRFRDPRRRVERAALREERATRALYRKAACKHRMRTRWLELTKVLTIAYWWGPSGAALTEKCEGAGKNGSTIIVSTNEVFASSSNNSASAAEEGGGGIINPLTPQINNLRSAYTLISHLLSRSRRNSTASRTEITAQSAQVDASAFSSISAGPPSTETLPAYSLPPPSYHSRRPRHGRRNSESSATMDGSGDSDISVVDGFTGYTPSTRSRSRDGLLERVDSRVTTSTAAGGSGVGVGLMDGTESSVVSCGSPRLSIDSR